MMLLLPVPAITGQITLSPLGASIAALAALVTALAGAYVALSKRKPEMTRVLVESAGELVVSQSNVLREAIEAAEALRSENTAMKRRLDALEQAAREQQQIQQVASAEIEDLHRELASMHAEVSALTMSRDQAREEARTAHAEVARLRAEVRVLRETLAAHGIEAPELPYATPTEEGQSDARDRD